MAQARRSIPSTLTPVLDPGVVVLVVGADAAPTASHLVGPGHRVRTASDAAAAARLLLHEPAAVVVVGEGYETPSLVEVARAADAHAQVILRGTGTPSPVATQVGAHAWVSAGDHASRLRFAVAAAVRTHAVLTESARAERRKTELLASVSHELRTPLNVILGYADLVQEGTFGELPEAAAGIVEKMRGNAAWLLNLVEELLELAHLDDGGDRVHCTAVDPTPLLQELGDSLRLLVESHGLAARCDLPDSLPTVRADAARLRVVIQNLLSNATKFTSAGHVRLAATTTADGGLRVVVEDTGPGIPTEDLEHVFDPYVQLEPQQGAGHGVGLGLALARRFARAMGGELTATSVVGAGATFTLVLPPASVEDAAARGAA